MDSLSKRVLMSGCSLWDSLLTHFEKTGLVPANQSRHKAFICYAFRIITRIA